MPLRTDPPSSDHWKPFDPVQLRDRLKDVPGLWYVAGGYALDLWHGVVTRRHDDLEFCILRDQFGMFRAALRDFDLFCASSGELTWLPEDQAPAEHVDQVWGLDPASRAWRFDMMIEPGTEDVWRYKRDISVSLPRQEAVRVAQPGIPYLSPAIVLLFKAKRTRPKDDLDFRNALPKLSWLDRRWLAEQIGRLHPGHRWLPALR